jgi:hypothetical protein
VDLAVAPPPAGQVVTKSSPSQGWQTRTTFGQQRDFDPSETDFWILVDLGERGTAPTYYVMPEWWIEHDIYRAHQEYLASHGGTRPVTPGSGHHQITRSRIEAWQDRWDILGIFSE